MPKAEKISLIVASICKEQGIEYNSANPHLLTLLEDAQKMGKIYLQLKEIMGILKEIEDRHDIKGLKNKFESLIKELDAADHLLIKLARELKDNDK